MKVEAHTCTRSVSDCRPTPVQTVTDFFVRVVNDSRGQFPEAVRVRFSEQLRLSSPRVSIGPSPRRVRHVVRSLPASDCAVTSETEALQTLTSLLQRREICLICAVTHASSVNQASHNALRIQRETRPCTETQRVTWFSY